jgi:RimJ/RimL family protein N-acetyltransferase
MVELAATLAVTRLVAHCHPEHRASQRVLEKCGFRLEAREPSATGYPNLDAAETRDSLRYARSF